MAAEVNGKGAWLEVGAVRPLFDTRLSGTLNMYDATADGRRFLVYYSPEQRTTSPITLVTNWIAGGKPH